MQRESLLQYFSDDARPAREIAFTWRRGYRTLRWDYAKLFSVATQFARELQTRGVNRGDRILLRGENSGEWAAAFLGCMFRGAIAVPIDATSTEDFATRVATSAGTKLSVASRSVSLECDISLDELTEAVSRHSSEPLTFPEMSRNEPVEIVFTSGTTAEPRGVVITHANLLSNLEPIEREIARYRRYERIFHPLRFLNLLPMSHIFGQLLGIFLPQMLGATTIFLGTLNPAEVMQAIHDEKVSLLVAVPRMIESLQAQIEREVVSADKEDKFRRDVESASGEHFLKRWWRFRRIHSRLGWKFWALLSGGAALPARAEQFWGRLGYAIIQGYGLTETTSLVSVNHPFKLRSGSIGKALPGMELKLADNGEIMVRGENISAGYWKDGGIATVRDAEGWFHTGDLGERDENGNLFFKGRSKNVMVTPEGLNVFPDDLEKELRLEPEVRDCVVVGLKHEGNAVPCAVLLMRDMEADAAGAVDRANARLAPFQQVRKWMVWRDQDFPRTSTQKPRLAEIRDAAEGEFGEGLSTARPSAMEQVLGRIQGMGSADAKDKVSGRIQLSSLERVDLLCALEDRYQVDLSETKFSAANTVEDIERLLRQPAGSSVTHQYPRWAQSRPVRWLRSAAFYFLMRPAMLLLGWPEVRGAEHLVGIGGPLLVVANHVTYLDPAYVLAGLPRRIRRRLSVAMAAHTLEGMRNPPAATGWFRSLVLRSQYWLVTALFNVFPLPQEAGIRKSFAFAGSLIDRGWSVLIFPEGVLTVDGQIAAFRTGIGVLASQLRIPILPMRIDGLYELKRAGKKWARPGQIRVTIGESLNFDPTQTPEEVARELERRVRDL